MSLSLIGISRFQLVSLQSELNIVVVTELTQEKLIGTEKVPLGVWPYRLYKRMDEQ